jgi:hypothetical protein
MQHGRSFVLQYMQPEVEFCNSNYSCMVNVNLAAGIQLVEAAVWSQAMQFLKQFPPYKCTSP